MLESRRGFFSGERFDVFDNDTLTPNTDDLTLNGATEGS
jgi:hypothetical protein